MTWRRRAVLTLGAGALAPLESFAQQPPAKVWRVGYLGSATAAAPTRNVEALRSGLRDLGYVEGKNIFIEYRWAEGKAERLPELAVELVRLNVDLIVTSGGAAAIASRRATSTIPIVVAASGDLVALGLATSLARPGGNLTGGTFFAAELSAKNVELIKEAIPGLTRAAVLLPAADPGSKMLMDTIAATANVLKVAVPPFTAQGGTDFEGAFAAMVKQRVGALVVSSSALLILNDKTIADLALRHRLPSIGRVDFAEVGGMLGYGVNFADMFHRAAVFVDKIFKGAKPGDIPIEQATRFDMVINMKTATALGIKIPGSILLRATKVIE